MIYNEKFHKMDHLGVSVLRFTMKLRGSPRAGWCVNVVEKPYEKQGSNPQVVDMGVSSSSWGYPPNGWFTMDNPIKIDDLGVALFQDLASYEARKHATSPTM